MAWTRCAVLVNPVDVMHNLGQTLGRQLVDDQEQRTGLWTMMAPKVN